MNDSQEQRWFVARTRHSQELALAEKLVDLHIEHFVPTRKDFRIRRGKRVRVDVPVIANLIFLKATKPDACALANGRGLPLYFIVDHSTRAMMEVPEKQMEDFRMVVEQRPDAVSADVPLVPGQRVRVISGDFAGVEGEILSTPDGDNLVITIGRILCAKVFIKSSDTELLH